MKLKPDKLLRDRWFVPDAMSHPAKGHLGLWWELFERYTKPGQWVLDPMAGIGSSMIGAMMGRNVICNEMESHFVEPMRASWAKMRQQAMLGCEIGQVVIIQGDARCLPLGRADTIITSPPYEEAQSDGGIAIKGHFNDPGLAQRVYSKANHTRPAAIVTSPPYEGSIQGEPGIDWSKIQKDGGPHAQGRITRDLTKEAAQSTRVASLSGYTRRAAVITSPPYANTNIGREESLGEAPFGGPHSQARGVQYAPAAASNIGNLRGEKYWEAMRLVYAECHRVLAPGGVMVLVVKGYTRDSVYVDLPQQTVDECEKLGFRLRERWTRELWNLSFWRILQQRRDPVAFDERLRFEPVLVLEKTE